MAHAHLVQSPPTIHLPMPIHLPNPHLHVQNHPKPSLPSIPLPSTSLPFPTHRQCFLPVSPAKPVSQVPRKREKLRQPRNTTKNPNPRKNPQNETSQKSLKFLSISILIPSFLPPKRSSFLHLPLADHVQRTAPRMYTNGCKTQTSSDETVYQPTKRSQNFEI